MQEKSYWREVWEPSGFTNNNLNISVN